MQFRIADTFTASLAKLTGQEQKAVKTTAFDLQLNPANPGLQFHKLDRSKDKNFWSVRVSSDLRLIVHRTDSSLLLCYVDHHDPAYAWAEKRKIERHPKTGAAQLVEVRETVEEVVIHSPVLQSEPSTPAAEASKPRLFANIADDDLLSYGVPAEWLAEVRAADEDALFELVDHLPQEAAEALIDLATGVTPQTATTSADTDPFQHPDAQRRFRLLTDVAELERALDFPWERWTVFLHPVQREYVERDYNGPARIAGSAGTGKTIVALHRAVYLAKRHPNAKVLLTTFSQTLANALTTKLGRLIGNDTAIRERIHVHPINGIGFEVYARQFGEPRIAAPALVRELIHQVQTTSEDAGRFSSRFLIGEWREVVDAWQLKTREAYRDVSRLGRKTRIGGKQREVLWSIFEQVRAELDQRQLLTEADLFGRVTEHLRSSGERPFDFAVVDEAQDIGIAELRFLAALGANRPDSLFFTGDLGQRIFQQPFSWKSLGVDVRGRSHTLRINYRTSHQIRSHADRLLPAALADVDGNVESRRGAVSVFNGPPPVVRVFDDKDEESEAVGDWIAERIDTQRLLPHEIGVFVRSEAQIERARAAVERAGATAVELNDRVETAQGAISIGTMHLAKGLEFRAVAVMACDDDVLPLQPRIESVADDSDLEEVYNTERHLLYVACTRARDELQVSGVDPASEFLDDMTG